MARIAVLLSIGRSPVSGRPRMARAEARAIEMALAGFDKQDVVGLHAAPSGSPILQEYLGLGLSSIMHVETRPDQDPLPALIERLRDIGPDIVLCGQAAEAGRASGMVAYACAEALGTPVIANVLSFERVGGDLVVVQGMGKGRYRQLRGPSPVVLAVDALQGSAARVPAMANIRAGRIETVPAVSGLAGSVTTALDPRPARVRPKRSMGSNAATARGGGVEHLDPERAAERILDYLRSNKIIQ